MDINEKINEFLQNNKNINLKSFNKKLIPNVSQDCILGVKIPVLRSFAKGLYRTENVNDFLVNLPHKFHEENHLHAFFIEQIKDFNECVLQTEKFLPYINNWAVCDCFKPIAFKKNKKLLLPYINKWLNGDNPWAIRFAVGMLLTHFLNDDFAPEQARAVAEIRSEEYYVNMMVAWYFATALAKRYQDVSCYLTDKVLPKFTHNKTIDKAVESFRVPDEIKSYLKTLKI